MRPRRPRSRHTRGCTNGKRPGALADVGFLPSPQGRGRSVQDEVILNGPREQ